MYSALLLLRSITLSSTPKDSPCTRIVLESSTCRLTIRNHTHLQTTTNQTILKSIMRINVDFSFSSFVRRISERIVFTSQPPRFVFSLSLLPSPRLLAFFSRFLFFWFSPKSHQFYFFISFSIVDCSAHFCSSQHDHRPFRDHLHSPSFILSVLWFIQFHCLFYHIFFSFFSFIRRLVI